MFVDEAHVMNFSKIPRWKGTMVELERSMCDVNRKCLTVGISTCPRTGINRDGGGAVHCS